MTKGGERAAAEARRVAGGEVEVALVDVRRHGAPGDDRVEEAWFAPLGDELQPALWFARPRPLVAVRGEQHLEAEHVVAGRGDGWIGDRRHVDHQRRPLEDAAGGEQRGCPIHLGDRRRDDERRRQPVVAVAQSRLTVDDRVDLRLVALGMLDPPPTLDHRRRAGRTAAQPADERALRIACRDDDRRGDLGAVGQGDARRPGSVAQHGVDGGAGAQVAAVVDECRPQRLGERSAPADRTADATDVAHGVGERAEPATRLLRADAPDHRPADQAGTEQGVVGEERAHDRRRAAPAPSQHGRRAGHPPAQARRVSPAAVGGSVATARISSAAGRAARR